MNVVAPQIQNRPTGVLFVAGAEGHTGHVLALGEMYESCFPIWVFEQNGYFINKHRPGPFLPLEVRLSMWCCDNRMGLTTVAPECPQGGDLNEHYQKLFDRTGAKWCFADILDPNAREKVRRGEFRGFNLLQHHSTAGTSDRVKRIEKTPEDIDHVLDFGGLEDPMQFKYPNFFETKNFGLDEDMFVK